MGSTHLPDGDHEQGRVTDTDLIAQLRAGETAAYETLWHRHVAAALRLARRYDPQHAEDIVSESFLAVYDQIVVAGNGPEKAFRAYLFTVIRNAAARNARHDAKVLSDPDVDSVDPNDGLTILSQDEDAADVLESFKALPDRWQRVLWLAEVDQAPRSDIAHELGIRPNAVSALLRRARSGLQNQWLSRHVPPALRTDPAHVARLLPDYITGGRVDISKAAVLVHLRRCETCRRLHVQMTGAHRRMQKVSLSVIGFAALGTNLPTSSPIPALAAAPLLPAFAFGTGGGVGLGAVVAGGVLVTTLVAGAPIIETDAAPHAPADRVPAAIEYARSAAPNPGSSDADERPQRRESATDAVELEEPHVVPGRGNDSDRVPSLDLEFDFDTIVTPRPRPPVPTPSPDPDVETPAPSPSPGPVTIPPLTVLGFEDTAEFTLAEASSSGIIFTAHGPAGGTLCIDSDSGQSAQVGLDDDGTVTRRIRFLSGGFYTIAFAICDGHTPEVPVEHSLFVDDPSLIFVPYDPDQMTIEISDPATDG